MGSKSRANKSRLCFESLESRTLLAGDVAAGLSLGGELSVIGDYASNGIAIREVSIDVADASLVTGGVTSVLLASSSACRTDM